MKSRTNQGMVELLMLIPLFIGITCIVAWIGFLLIQKTKMEKHAWVIQVQKTYDLDDDMAELNPEYRIESDGLLSTIWANRRSFSTHIPITISAFQTRYPTLYKKLVLENSSPNIIQSFFTAGFKDTQNIVSNQFSAEMMIPGNPMNDSFFAKHGIWFEAMRKAGFGYDLLMLGIPEVAGIPTRFLGDFAKEKTNELP